MEIKVWDGTTPTRGNLSDVKNPDHMDYVFLVTELQKLQEAFLHFVQNITLMPNLQGEFDKALVTIAELHDIIATLTPPQELMNRLAKFEQALAEQDTRKKLAILHGITEGLRSQIDQYQLQVLKIQEAFAIQVVAFQNKVWNALQQSDKEIQSRLDATEKKLEDVSLQTRILSLQQELNN